MGSAVTSIRQRLILSLLACIATVAVLLFFIVQSYASTLAADSQNKILQASATSILDAISVQNGDVSVDIPYSALSMLGTLSDDRVYYHVTSDASTITGYEDLPIAKNITTNNAYRFETTRYRDNAVRLVTGERDITIKSKRVVVRVTVAQTLDGQENVLQGILRNTLIMCLGFFVVASLIGWIAVHISLTPLRQFAEAISRRGPQDLRRVTAAAPSEMAPLVTSLNDLIDRLRFSLSRTEEFLTEAAHRVRTPLATVRAEAEVALHRVEKEKNRTSLKNMIRAIDQTSRAAGQLIDHAMVSYRNDRKALSPVDMSALCDEVVSRLAPVAELRDIRVQLTQSAGCQVCGDSILLQNAVQNILDNAIKYSPRDSVIDVEVKRRDDQVLLSIQDEGIGFVDEDAETLKQRFVRGKNVDKVVGSGLGLTIVLDVVASHGGDLQLAQRDDRSGASVVMVLPVLSDTSAVRIDDLRKKPE